MSFYINLDKLGESLDASATDSLNNSLTAGYGSYGASLSSSNEGFIVSTYESFDESKLNKDLASYLFAKNTSFEYLAKLPATTAYASEGSELGSGLKYISAFKLDKDTTIDQNTESSVGFKLSDFAAALSGKFSISLQPESNEALVMQAKLADQSAMNQFVTKIRTAIETAYPITSQVVNGTTIYSSPTGSEALLDSFAGLSTYPKMKDYFNPSFAVSADHLIISTNLSGIKSALSGISGPALSADSQLITNQKVVSTQGTNMMHLDSQRFYNSIVNAVRDITNNPDKSVSNQEKVIAAMLKVFPGFTLTSHGEKGTAASTIIFPVVELPATEKTEINQILKTDYNSVFDLTPFFSTSSTSSDNKSISSTNASTDSLKKANANAILLAVTDASPSVTTFGLYQTTGEEKLDPASGVMKTMIDAGDVPSSAVDPEWPNYYYSLFNDGSTVRVSALLTTRPTDSCLPTTQVRERWTWCVQQLAASN